MKTPLLLASLALAFGSAWAASPASTKHSAMHHTAAASSTPAKGVWDWALIDTNKDHLIEPAEMESFLASHPGPLKKTG
ncbi:MAG TPA: hypothetical protein VLU41_06270 [Ideonella sp.]|nr:hypothetical protein [Ideonella sp.]